MNNDKIVAFGKNPNSDVIGIWLKWAQPKGVLMLEIKLDVRNTDIKLVNDFLMLLDLKKVIMIVGKRDDTGTVCVQIASNDERYPIIVIKGGYDIGNESKGAKALYAVMQETQLPKEEAKKVFSHKSKNFFSVSVRNCH